MNKQEELQNAVAAAEQTAIMNQIIDPFGLGIKAEEAKKVEEKKEVEDKGVVTLPLMSLDIKDNPYQKLNEATGNDFKTEAEVVEALKKSKGFEEREKDYQERVAKGQTYVEFLETLLPEKLKAPIVAFVNDQDWESVAKTVFGVSEVDFSKPWGEYDDHVPLIQKYNPDLSQEDWDALDEKQKDTYIKLSKSAYTKERTDWQKTQTADISTVKAKLDKRAEAIKASIEESVADLKKNHPNLKEDQISEVRSKMYRSPLTGIVNPDGTFTKEAATKLAFADFGQQTLTQAIEAVENKYKAELEKTKKEVGGQRLEVQVKAANDVVPKSETKEKDNIHEKMKEQVRKISSNPADMFINQHK